MEIMSSLTEAGEVDCGVISDQGKLKDVQTSATVETALADREEIAECPRFKRIPRVG